ncbi:hypothetical protein LX32DRAFT_718023, partial [Colletotrichum zoysiae]
MDAPENLPSDSPIRKSRYDNLEAGDAAARSSPVATSHELTRFDPQISRTAAKPSGPATPIFPNDPLLLARCVIERGGEVIEEDLMQALLAPGTFTRTIYTQRMARVHFAHETEALYSCLKFNGKSLYRSSAPIEYGGQFRIALDEVLSLCKGQITSEPDARRVTLHWEIHSRCDPPSANAASEQEDAETALPKADCDTPGVGDTNEGDKSITDDNEDVEDEYVRAAPVRDPKGVDGDEIPEPTEAPADDIEKIIISSDSDSDDEENDGSLKTIACTSEELKGDQNIKDMMELKDDAAGWRQTCLFFGHDEGSNTIDESHCRKLPGTKRALRPHQMYDVHKVFQSVTNGTGDLGAILAHQMGVGKTMTYQAIMAVRRLAIISLSHYQRYSEQHKS